MSAPSGSISACRSAEVDERFAADAETIFGGAGAVNANDSDSAVPAVRGLFRGGDQPVTVGRTRHEMFELRGDGMRFIQSRVNFRWFARRLLSVRETFFLVRQRVLVGAGFHVLKVAFADGRRRRVAFLLRVHRPVQHRARGRALARRVERHGRVVPPRPPHIDRVPFRFADIDVALRVDGHCIRQRQRTFPRLGYLSDEPARLCFEFVDRSNPVDISER